MNVWLLQLLLVIYLLGIVSLQRRHWSLLLYLWSAFGLAFLIIQFAVLQNWHAALASLEASQLTGIMNALGVQLQLVDRTMLMVPDSTGWSGLRIGVESSTLIELSVLAGLLLFYPKQTPRQRSVFLMIGLTGTYVLNLLRLMVIVGMILIWGKPAVPLAHTVVGRLLYFGGVVMLYWFLMTRPTLRTVYDVMKGSGRLQR
jgi:exosortase family protein XrtG